MTDQLNFSELESERFGLNIFRGVITAFDITKIKNFIIDNDVDVLIFRIKSDSIDQLFKLNELNYPFIQADTLVIYNVLLNRYKPNELRNKHLEFIEATIDDMETINSLVEQIFIGYTNHYNSNPLLDKSDINEGYKAWVNSFVGVENKTVFLVKRKEEYIGFASVAYKDGVGEGVLYGVLPKASGSGVYTDIMRYTQSYLKEKGINRMKVSTQIQNYSVQKVWTKEGFLIKDSFATVHVNSLVRLSLSGEGRSL